MPSPGGLWSAFAFIRVIRLIRAIRATRNTNEKNEKNGRESGLVGTDHRKAIPTILANPIRPSAPGVRCRLGPRFRSTVSPVVFRLAPRRD